MLQTLLGILTTLMTILKFLPDAIKLGWQVWNLISEIVRKEDQKKKVEEFKQAIEKARIEKDTSALEDMFGKRAAAQIMARRYDPADFSEPEKLQDGFLKEEEWLKPEEKKKP